LPAFCQQISACLQQKLPAKSSMILIYIDFLAHPTGFEPVTSAFGARCLSAKYLKLLQRMLANQHERFRNITALSGNNPEAQMVLLRL
jgi:hypothetical protein